MSKLTLWIFIICRTFRKFGEVYHNVLFHRNNLSTTVYKCLRRFRHWLRRNNTWIGPPDLDRSTYDITTTVFLKVLSTVHVQGMSQTRPNSNLPRHNCPTNISRLHVNWYIWLLSQQWIFNSYLKKTWAHHLRAYAQLLSTSLLHFL